MAGVGHLKRILKDAFAWQVQYKRHVHQRCSGVRALISWEGLHFGVSDLQVCWDDFAWRVQHFVWPGINFSWQAQYFTQVEWKNRKTHWYEAPSAALNFPFLKEVSQNCFVFDVVKFKHWGSLAELLRVLDVVRLKDKRRSPLKLAPWGQTPPFIDTEWGALKKAYKMDGHQEFAWIQNGRAQSEPWCPKKQYYFVEAKFSPLNQLHQR